MKTYRTIVLRCEPDSETRKALDTAFVKVGEFMEMSRTEFSKVLYHKYRESSKLSDAELKTRIVNLLAERFSKTVTKQQILPLDEQCYRLVKKNGAWFLEVRILGKYEGKKLKKGTSWLIPIYKTDNKYYGMLLEGSAYPLALFKEGEIYKAAISVPVEIKFDANRPIVTLGINLTMWKHAASLYNPQSGKFERNVFHDTRWLDEKAKRIQKNISRLQRQTRLGSPARELVNLKISELHGKISELIKLSHGNFIARLVKIADEYWDKGYNVVFSLRDMKGFGEISFRYPWLNYKLRSLLAWRKFANMLETRGYPVVYCLPKLKTCHRCGSEGEIVKREFRCSSCGLRRFSAELNLARNIAKAGLERAKKRRFFQAA